LCFTVASDDSERCVTSFKKDQCFECCKCSEMLFYFSVSVHFTCKCEWDYPG